MHPQPEPGPEQADQPEQPEQPEQQAQPGQREQQQDERSPLTGPRLSLAEWTVLAVVGEQPVHGFAIGALTAPGAPLGRVWHIPRPLVYRALGRLAGAGLVAPGAVEAGNGPMRTIYTATPAGDRKSVV